MTTRELLAALLAKSGRSQIEYTILVAKAVKDEHSPLFRAAYQPTPIWHYHDGIESNWLDGLHCLNCDQMPIDWESGSNWRAHWRSGDVKCFVAISMDDLKKVNGSRSEDLIEYCEKKIREKLGLPQKDHK